MNKCNVHLEGHSNGQLLQENPFLGSTEEYKNKQMTLYTSVQKYGVSEISFKKIYTFTQQGCVK